MRSSLFAVTAIVKARSRAAGIRRVLFSGHAMDQLTDNDVQFMQQALDEGRAAAQAGEVPVGAVLAHEGVVIARSGNRTIRDTDPTAHAEIVVVRLQ